MYSKYFIALLFVYTFISLAQEEQYKHWKENHLHKLEHEEIKTLAGHVLYFTKLFAEALEEQEKVQAGSLESQTCSQEVPHYTTTFSLLYKQEMLYAYN